MASTKSPFSSAPFVVEENLKKKYGYMWDEIRNLRTDGERSKSDWTDLCFVPSHNVDEVFFKYNPQMLDVRNIKRIDEAALGLCIFGSYLWGQNKCIFRFNDNLYQDLRGCELQGAIPIRTLYQLPYHAVYIETPNLDFQYDSYINYGKLKGFIMYINYDVTKRRQEIQLLLFLKELFYPLPFNMPFEENDDIDDVINRIIDYRKENAEMMGVEYKAKIDCDDYKDKCSFILNLLLYICVKDSDYMIKDRVEANNRMATKPSIINVGENIGAKIKEYRTSSAKQYIYEQDNKSGSRKAKHIRKAHYQLYWTGEGRTTPKIVFKHPCFVNFDNEGEMRPTIYDVK